MDDGAEFTCPYCSTGAWIAVDPTGGRAQRLIADCEVCCSPIVFDVRIDRAGGVTVTASAESR